MKTYELKNGLSFVGNGLTHARITESFDPETTTKYVLCIHWSCDNKVQELMFIKTVHTSLKAAKKYFLRNYDFMRQDNDCFASAVWSV